MSKRAPILLGLIAFATTSVFAQGLETTAKKDDWEEINFEFDSDILTDGYPSLLRLADLLNENGDYTVALVGHTDFRGSDNYNVGPRPSRRSSSSTEPATTRSRSRPRASQPPRSRTKPTKAVS